MIGTLFFPKSVQPESALVGQFFVVIGKDDKNNLLLTLASDPMKSRQNIIGCDTEAPYFVLDPSTDHCIYPFRFCIPLFNEALAIANATNLAKAGIFQDKLSDDIKKSILNCIERHSTRLTDIQLDMARNKN